MKIKLPKITVAIVNFNSVKETLECLSSAMKTKYSNFEIYVLDNGSTLDESILIKRRFKSKKIHVIRSEDNLGFAGGNNFLINKSKSKYVVLLNNDTIVDSNWLFELVRVAESDKKIAAVQPKIKNYYQREYFEYAGAAGGLVDALGYPYARGRIGFHVEKDIGQYDQIVDVFWSSGACMLVNRKVFINLGMLSEDFFFYHEETDLCWRMKRKGYRVVFTPFTSIYHKGSGSSKNDSALKIFYVHRNALYLLVRNLFLRELVLILPIRMLLDYLTMFIYSVKYRQPKHALSVIKSHLQFFANLKKLIRTRDFSGERFKGSEARYPFSVFFNHYLLKQKNYFQLSGIIFPIDTVNTKERLGKI